LVFQSLLENQKVLNLDCAIGVF